MRVLVDLRCLETASAGRGLGRYTAELVQALRAEVASEWTLLALSWQGQGARFGLEDVVYRGPRRGIGWADRWVLPRLFRERRIDVYHATTYALPRANRGTALVLTLHDLVADLHPEALSARHRLAFRRTFRSALSADRVITVSETTRRDLLALYPVDAAKVIVIPNGVGRVFGGESSGLGRAPLVPPPFLLYVGGLDPLKNVPFLLEVLTRVRRSAPEMRLVVAGEEGPRQQELVRRAMSMGLEEHVRAVGRLADADLAQAYRDATAFVFPSRYEGFGLPPLEAMASGCPVVSSPAGALAEVLDGDAFLCDPEDADAWSAAVLALLRDPDARSRRVDAGRLRAASFTWEAAARSTLLVYESARRGARR